MKYKYTCKAVKWFDRVNGNTYHSVRITNSNNGKICASGMVYGYGEQYKNTALEHMFKCKWLPKKYQDNLYMYERENNYPINWIVIDGLKRDLKENSIIRI